jgi:hypothetical protein
MVPGPIRLAFAMDGLLILLHLANAIPIPPLERPTLFLDLGIEGNLPTWWASVQLWTAAVLIGYVGWRRAGNLVTFALATFIGILSLDEFARLHERIAESTRSELLPVTGLWPVLLAPAALVVVLTTAWLGRSTWQRDRVAAAWLGAGLLGLVASAAGIELIINFMDLESFAYAIEQLLEESGELVAGTLIVAGAYRFAAMPLPSPRRPLPPGTLTDPN